MKEDYIKKCNLTWKDIFSIKYKDFLNEKVVWKDLKSIIFTIKQNLHIFL